MPDDTSSSAASPYEIFDDPLYVTNTDQPSNTLVSVKFNGNNFMNWKRKALLALIAKNKDGFVDGSFKMPTVGDKSRNQWVRCDILVMRWIKNSIKPVIAATFQYATSSKELWCACQLLKRFLMGLNNGYETVKTTVLTMKPLPPLNKALGLLQKIERQKQLTETNVILTEAAAYAAGRTTDAQQGDWKRRKQEAPVVERKFYTHCKRGGHNVESCFHLQTCESCGKKGHIAAHCYLKPKFADQQRSTTNKHYKGKNNFSRGCYTG
ncbi:uncharacterized protein LOC141600216 [Silene latifolia]|uniref:uncharacterized protein LOC141600216 n=1 Tax=Silene latifolia TaxID=37657 RepID=UPI003D77094C